MGAAAQTLQPGPHHIQGLPVLPCVLPQDHLTSTLAAPRHPQPPCKALHSEGLLLHPLPTLITNTEQQHPSPPHCSAATQTPRPPLAPGRAKDGASKSLGSKEFESSNALEQSPTSHVQHPAQPRSCFVEGKLDFQAWQELRNHFAGQSLKSWESAFHWGAKASSHPGQAACGSQEAREASEVVWLE